jgi:hypothetical protein
MKTLALLCALVAVALAGCGGDETSDEDAAGGAGSAISIDDALASGSDDELLVSGLLLAHGDDVRLCSALAESFPPQCGGASLAVVGLSLEEVAGLVTHGDVHWTDQPLELRGVVADETLTVRGNAP